MNLVDPIVQNSYIFGGKDLQSNCKDVMPASSEEKRRHSVQLKNSLAAPSFSAISWLKAG